MDKDKQKVEAWRIECPFCKNDFSAMSRCRTCDGKKEVIIIEIGNGKTQIIPVG